VAIIVGGPATWLASTLYSFSEVADARRFRMMQTDNVASKTKTKRQPIAVVILAPLGILSLQTSLPVWSLVHTDQLKAAEAVGRHEKANNPSETEKADLSNISTNSALLIIPE